MLNYNTIITLLTTVATIVATLTGLIGAFSTFRLQNIDTEIDFLKGYILSKKVFKEKILSDYITANNYHLMEKIYDPNLKAIDLLEEVIKKHDFHLYNDEFTHDLNNLRGNQNRYLRIKRLTLYSFIASLAFVFISLVSIIFIKTLVTRLAVNYFLMVYFLVLFGLFFQYVKQINILIK